MKKFSKILTRRLGGRPGHDDGPDSRPPTRDSSPDYHQLNSRRANGLVPLRQRSFPRTGSSRIVADGPGDDADDQDEPPLPPLPHERNGEHLNGHASNGLAPPPKSRSRSRSRSRSPGAKPPRPRRPRPCATCRRTDFPKLLDWRPGDPRPWVSLSHALQADDEAAAACPFCAFFQAMVGAAPDDTGKFAPYLRIRLAFERLGGLGERHELGRAVLIEVTTRDKTLPWGYIVKAAPAEGRALDEGQEGEADAEGEGGRVNVDGYLGKEPAALRGRMVSPLLDPALPRTWIDFCKEHHHDQPCGKAEAPIKGLRLVDCETRKIVSLDDIKGDGEGSEYVTLSYVRGSSTDSEVPQGTDAGDLPEKVPVLISDAISFTRSLGFRYLWIDRYCMPAAKAERRRQFDLMGEIYARSALTLIVAAGEGVQDGIPGVSVPREDQLSLKTQTGLFTTSLLRPDLEVGSSKWASRAWTFQEGLLSTRRLVFTPSQIYFQCQTLHCHESISLPLHLAPNVNLGRVFPDTAATASQPRHIKNQIKAFIPKELARNDDRLDAFRGVLHRYANMPLAVDSLVGLPLFHPDDFKNARVVSQTDRLAVGLGWTPNHAVPLQGYVDPYFREGGFPSWTWLAWRLRPGHGTLNHMFHFNLVEETSPALDGVEAAPEMEISVGFEDQMVLSWEIDGDAIARKAERIAFLRVETFCFDVKVSKQGDAVTLVDACLGGSGKEVVEAWFRASMPVPAPAPKTDSDSTEVPDPAAAGLPDGEYGLIGVLLSGRHWKEPAVPSAGTVAATESVATALILAREGHSPDGRLVRLGVLSISYEGFARDGDSAVMRGVETGEKEGDEVKKKDLKVRSRELDIY